MEQVSVIFKNYPSQKESRMREIRGSTTSSIKKVVDELSEFDVKKKRKECLEDSAWKK